LPTTFFRITVNTRGRALLTAAAEMRSIKNICHFIAEVLRAECAPARLAEFVKKNGVPEGQPLGKHLPRLPKKYLSAGEEKRRAFAERIEQIISLHEQGLKTSAIAARVNCSSMTVGPHPETSPGMKPEKIR